MRWILSAVVIVPSLAFALADDKERAFEFSKSEVGKTPAGWKADQTGAGTGSVWKVVADDTTPSKSGFALAQTAASAKALFNLCVADDTSFTDLEASVALKSMKGEIDQGGGIVWRYRDANNYYIARYNPLESNFRVYKVINGKRTQLETEEGIQVPAGKWTTLSIRMVGNQIECSLDGKKLLTTKDDTITKAGKIGLWSKADAQTHFDGFKVRSVK